MNAITFLVGLAVGAASGVGFGLAYADAWLAHVARRNRQRRTNHPTSTVDALFGSPSPFNRTGAKK
jgi:hypothetical protein